MAEENVILVTFEEESKAYQAANVLKEANADGRITLHAVAVLQRMEDGALRVRRERRMPCPSLPGPRAPLARRPVGS
jgi:uncharacterized membrane protein